VQAQELSCGQVVYTGMSDNGDFYIGNTKYSATSGLQITFDVPIPTVAGQKASSNNVVFDEVIVNQRLFVAGGETNQVLSQFDGPVKFTQSVNLENTLGVTGESRFNTVDILSQENSISITDGGALTVRGGAAISKDLYLGGNLYATGDLATNVILAAEPDSPISLFENQNNGILGIGSQPGQVVFNTTVEATGEGGDEIATADAGVVIEGGLVVRGTLLAGEVKANGLGKPGTVIMWGGTINNVPEGYLLCNGASYNSTTYNKLFDAIGYVHGGSGNNFQVPDLRDRFIVGAGSQYVTANTGGSNTVVLTEAQLASHTHIIDDTNLSHTHPLETGTAALQELNLSVSGSTDDDTGRHTHSSGETSRVGNHAHSINDPGHRHEIASYLIDENTERSGGNIFDDDRRTDQRDLETSSKGTGISINGAGAHEHSLTVNNQQSEHNHTLSATGTADHSHNLSGNTDTALGLHNHPAQATGSNSPHENRPPYYALVYLIQYK
jgi:microcystin-dependent protein